MKIKWHIDVTLETEEFDDELGQEVEGSIEFKAGDEVEVSVIDDYTEAMDLQFHPDGQIVWNVCADDFEVIEED